MKEVKNKCLKCHAKAKSWVRNKTGLNLCGAHIPEELKKQAKSK